MNTVFVRLVGHATQTRLKQDRCWVQHRPLILLRYRSSTLSSRPDFRPPSLSLPFARPAPFSPHNPIPPNKTCSGFLRAG